MKDAVTSSGLTSLVLVIVPLMFINFPIFEVLSSRILKISEMMEFRVKVECLLVAVGCVIESYVEPFLLCPVEVEFLHKLF